MPSNIIAAVKEFTEAVGCTVDRYNVRQLALYTGLQLEEMAERFEAIFGPENPISADMHALANDFKKGEWDIMIEKADREALLDADIDLAWVTIGSMLSQGANVEGAIEEVKRANMSKLTPCPVCDGSGYDEHSDGTILKDCDNCNGLGLVVLKDSNGKVTKPEGWVAPSNKSFVCKE